MKKLGYAILGATMMMSTVAFANDDALIGDYKMSEDGQEKAIVSFSKVGDVYQAIMTKGLTEKAKKREGRVVIKDIKAQGDGKYVGRGKHPILPISGEAVITLNGDNITIKSRAGTQTGIRQ